MNSPFTNIESIPEKELLPGFNARLIHMEGMSIAYVNIAQDAVLPEHHHFQEQISSIIEGEFEFTVNGETKLCKAGDVVVLPSNVPHSVRAIKAGLVIDVFQPARDDYK